MNSDSLSLSNAPDLISSSPCSALIFLALLYLNFPIHNFWLNYLPASWLAFSYYYKPCSSLTFHYYWEQLEIGAKSVWKARLIIMFLSKKSKVATFCGQLANSAFVHFNCLLLVAKQSTFFYKREILHSITPSVEKESRFIIGFFPGRIIFCKSIPPLESEMSFAFFFDEHLVALSAETWSSQHWTKGEIDWLIRNWVKDLKLSHTVAFRGGEINDFDIIFPVGLVVF